MNYFLTHLYASNEGVLTNVLEYCYQLVIVKDESMYKKLNKLLNRELNHLNILGKLIYKYGKDPIYAEVNNNLINYYNTNNVYYDTDLLTILDIDIELKKKNIKNIKMVIHTIKDEEIIFALNELLKDDYDSLTELMHMRY